MFKASAKIFLIIKVAVCKSGARKKTHVRQMKKNVSRIFENFSNDERKALLRSAVPRVFRRRNDAGRTATPLSPPHRMKFQDAPCHKPLSRNVSKTFKALRSFEPLKPPSEKKT